MTIEFWGLDKFLKIFFRRWRFGGGIFLKVIDLFVFSKDFAVAAGN
jgi:hypothetical protein